MKRYGGHFEAEADRQERDPEDAEGTERVGRQRDAHQSEVGRPSGPEEQRHTVNQEGAGEGAQQEVLEGRLGRTRIAPVDPHEHVDGERHELEAEEDEDQVTAPRQEHHPEHCEEE